jgi:Tfp pilus assembly protein PilO
MKLSSRDQMIVAAVVILLVGVAFAFLLIVPQFTALSQAKADSAKADADILAAKQLLAKRQEAKSAAAQTQASLLKIDNEMPDAPEMPAVIIELQDTANDAGVDFDDLKVTRPAPATDGSYSKIGLTFNVAGQWDDVTDYLYKLPALQRGVRVLSVALVPGAPASGSTETTASADDAPQRIHANVHS